MPGFFEALLGEPLAKHREGHEQWRFDVGIYRSEWPPLKTHRNCQDKVLHQMAAVFLGNPRTVIFLCGALLAERIEHIYLTESFLVVYDIFGISLLFETPGTQYKK